MTEKMRARLDIGMKLLATFAAIFGIGKYFYELGLAEELAQKRESQKIIAVYSSENVRAARVSLVHFWVKQPNFLGMEKLAGGASKRAYQALARKKLNIGDEALWRDLFVLSSFFDEAWFCRETELCNAEILDEFICKKSKSIGKTYGGFFDAMNAQLRTSDFGRSLDLYKNICRT